MWSTARGGIGVQVVGRLLVGGLLVTAALTLLGQPPARSTTSSSTTEITIVTPDGNTRQVDYYVPAGLEGAAPLVVALHGYSNTWKNIQADTGFDSLAGTKHFVVAYPSGMNESWNAGGCCGSDRVQNIDDVTFLDMVIDEASKIYPINPSRVHLAAFSNGGMMAYRYACERSERVSSIAVDAATMVLPSCAASHPVAVFHMHSDTDTTVPYLGCSNGQAGTGCANPALSPNLPSVPSVLAQWGQLDWLGCTAPVLKVLHKGPHRWPTVANASYDGGAASWGFFWAHPRHTAAAGQDPALPKACLLLNRAITTNNRRFDKIVFPGIVRPAAPGTHLLIESRAHVRGAWRSVKTLTLAGSAHQESTANWTWLPKSTGDYDWRVSWSDKTTRYYSSNYRTIVRS